MNRVLSSFRLLLKRQYKVNLDLISSLLYSGKPTFSQGKYMGSLPGYDGSEYIQLRFGLYQTRMWSKHIARKMEIQIVISSKLSNNKSNSLSCIQVILLSKYSFVLCHPLSLGLEQEDVLIFYFRTEVQLLRFRIYLNSLRSFLKFKYLSWLYIWTESSRIRLFRRGYFIF